MTDIHPPSPHDANFYYDGDGNRVLSIVGGVGTVYIGDYYEYKVETGITRSYYGSGSAMRVAGASDPEANGVFYLLKDHLSSTNLTVDSAGNVLGEMRYKAWGETRYASGTTPTDFAYTGQRQEQYLGFYYYKARWYDPVLGRFMQADSIVPEPGNPMALDRFSYVYNNPMSCVDPTGHVIKIPCPFCDEEEDISDWPEWLKKLVKGLSWISPMPFEVDLEEDVIRGPTHQEMLDSSVINIGFNPIGLAYAPITNLGKRGLQEIAEEAIEIAVRKFKLDESKFIRFGQNSISRMFRHGEFAGMTIDDVAKGLQSGRINPDQLPIKIIERDGIRYSLNNRSLMALRLAGIEPTIVENVTGNSFFERQLTERLKEIGEEVSLYFVPIIRGARWAR